MHSSTVMRRRQSRCRLSVIKQLLIAWILMASNVAIHATGIVAAVTYLRGKRGPAKWTRVFVGLAGWIILLHGVEIVIWGVVYAWIDAIADLQSSLYFSAVTYTTTGYGDVVLPHSWRLVGAVEALTGILMCGWSTGFFFAVLSRMVQDREEARA